jgi:uncharacterized membrane protein YkvA (DUF1232 family)
MMKIQMRFVSQILDWVTTPYTIYLIIKDSTVSAAVKIRAIIGLAAILAYVVSPIDIIPDFIPFSGWIDDLVIVPLGIALVRKITPGIDVIEKRNMAQMSVKRILLRIIPILVVAILLGLFLFGLLIYLLVRSIPLR